MPIEDRLDRIEKLLTMIWNQQQVQKHEPHAVTLKPVHPRIIEIAQEIVDRHPAAKTMNHETAYRLLDQQVDKMVNPIASALAINKLHLWRCRYEWAGRETAFVPKLFRWLQDEAFAPCPTDSEGEAMLRQPERMSRTERDLLELQREMGG